MKHKNVEVGQRVIIKRSTSYMWDTAAGQFHVVEVEPLDYCNGDTRGATVRVENSDSGVAFWCNHRDLKLVKEEAPKPEIGALFVVTGCTTSCPCFAVGTVVRCAEAPSLVMSNFRDEDTDGTRQFVSPSDLKPLSLADIQAALDK